MSLHANKSINNRILMLHECIDIFLLFRSRMMHWTYLWLFIFICLKISIPPYIHHRLASSFHFSISQIYLIVPILAVSKAWVLHIGLNIEWKLFELMNFHPNRTWSFIHVKGQSGFHGIYKDINYSQEWSLKILTFFKNMM